MIEQTEHMKLQTTLGNIDLKNFAAGKQAQCLRLNNWGEYQGDAILKLIGEGKGFTKEEAEELVDQTKQYRQELADANVPIPTNLSITTHFNGAEHQIVMVDEFAGNGLDCKGILSNGAWDEPVRVIVKIVNFLHELPAGERPFSTKVMGDFKPDNFVYVNGQLVLIDYFAPKRVDVDGLVSPYSPKADVISRAGITFLCGDRRGQIVRLLALLKRDHPQYLTRTIQEIEQVYQDMPEVLNFVRTQVNENFVGIDQVYQDKDWSIRI